MCIRDSNGTLQMAFCWNIAQQLNSDNNDADLTNSGDEIFPMAFPTDSVVVAVGLLCNVPAECHLQRCV